MAEITFLQDEQGNFHAYDFINHLFNQANGKAQPPIDPLFPGFIQKGLENLEAADHFPVGRRGTIYEQTLIYEGRKRTIELVKPLLVSPIYELRVDWNWNCKFRAIFFPFTYQDKNHYCFVKAFIKTQKPKYDPTDIYRDEAKRIYDKVRRDPGKYLA
jgi:hypothetical protein